MLAHTRAVQVTASNSVGASAASSAFTATVPTVAPGAPTLLDANTAVGGMPDADVGCHTMTSLRVFFLCVLGSHITVFWSAPSYLGSTGSLVGYNVTTASSASGAGNSAYTPTRGGGGVTPGAGVSGPPPEPGLTPGAGVSGPPRESLVAVQLLAS